VRRKVSKRSVLRVDGQKFEVTGYKVLSSETPVDLRTILLRRVCHMLTKGRARDKGTDDDVGD
jgi:hypothetical protein